MFTLHTDADAWRSHADDVAARLPDVVPVAKGNGYGFGLGRLAEVTEQLGLDTLAVGTYAEVPVVEQHFGGSLLVLSPWREFETRATYDPRLIHTVGRVGDVRSLAASAGPHQPRVALERKKRPGSVARSFIRMRSPRRAPPEYGDVGSTATTPTRSSLSR